MRRRNRRRIGGVGHCPTPPPPVDAIGRTNHVFVDTSDVVAGAAHTIVSLFCGAGGIDIGFHAAGFRTALAVEMDEDAAATYQANFPFADLILSDVREVTDDEVLSRLQDVEVDVLAAGWPCQGMSPAGDQDPLDPRNHLYLEVIRFARLLRPKVIVLENVPDLLGRRFRHLLDDLLTRLADAGYADASVLVLDAADYGVPQHRERLITLLNRLGEPNAYPLPLPLQRYVSVRETITDLADAPDDVALNHLRIRHRAERVERIGRLGPGESLNQGHSLSARRLIADQPANTVLWGHGTLLVHPWLDRTLTVREAARLQGFPDDHWLLGSQNAQGSQVGNAVPPPMARCVALAVRSMLDGGGVISRGEIAGDAAGPPCPSAM